jgi:hypothetical protein
MQLDTILRLAEVGADVRVAIIFLTADGAFLTAEGAEKLHTN